MTQSKVFLLLAISLIALSSCSNARRSLGLERNAPDEFRVVSRAPLSVPPDFSLRPPMPGMQQTQAVDPKQQAAQSLLGQPGAKKSASTDNGEAKFLSQLGADKADPNIRATLERETQQLVSANKTLIDRITRFDPSAVTVDAAKEKERLEKNKAENLPANSGEVPTITPRKKGIF